MLNSIERNQKVGVGEHVKPFLLVPQHLNRSCLYFMLSQLILKEENEDD